MDINKQKKPIYKRVWFWILIVLVLIGIGGASTTQNKTQTNNTNEPAKQDPAPAAWDMEAAYAKVTNGMTKAEVEQATGKKAENCTESQSEYIGKSEVCSYGNAFIDKGAITVTYMQDKVSSKTKSTY
jgi:hypothetical protein